MRSFPTHIPEPGLPLEPTKIPVHGPAVRRPPVILWVSLLVLTFAIGCGGEEGEENSTESENTSADPSVDDLENVSAAAADEETRRALEAALDREFPLHGLVTRTSLQVRADPNPEGAVIGWLRWGERIRLAGDPQSGENCASGWYHIAPRGFACAGQGIEVGEAPPEVEGIVPPADRERSLPYNYYLVKDRMTPEYHQLPSRDQQRAARTYGDRYLEMLDANLERRAARFLAGELPGEPRRHAAIARYLNRNFFIASTDVQVRSRRRFARTTGGGFVKVAHLEERTGSDFHGLELGDGEGQHQLPLRFLLRDARPLRHVERADGTHRFPRDEEAEVLPRQELVANYAERQRIGDHFYHRLEADMYDGPRYLRDWFVSTIEAIEPPFELEEGEPWVHVDLSSQSLVIYRGETPVYATLVSTGIDGHDTPTGTFTIHKKAITDTMANLGPDAGDDAYRIQDVPWTQYFEGSFALHTAFWHHRFGLRRSHGCVNIAPTDALRVFQETWPRIPDGWHAVSTDRTGFRGSRVHVTD